MARRCKNRFRALVTIAWCLFAAATGVIGQGTRLPEVKLTPQDRLLVLAPHPDDEVLGCGGVIQQALDMKLPVRVVFLTYGDANEWSFLVYRKHPVLLPGSVRLMGQVRHDEALAATKLLGVPAEGLAFLGYPDFGTMRIWREHWNNEDAFRSTFTRVRAVPYANAFRPGAPYKGEDVVQDLTALIREFRPTKIFVSHPADHNGDHRALYLFTRVTLWNLAGEMQPEVYPYLIHFAKWPAPRGYHPEKSLAPPPQLKGGPGWQTFALTAEQINRKYAALRAHRSQFAYSGKYLQSFACANELFSDYAPVVLRTNTPTSSVLEGGTARAAESSETLTETEQAAFIGVEHEYVRLEQSNLVFSVKLSRPLTREVEASLSICGYRTDRPFGQMPKLHVRIGENGYTVSNQDRKLPRQTIEVSRTDKEMTIRVPLDALGDPQRVLTSARTLLADVSLDWAAWRILELPANR